MPKEAKPIPFEEQLAQLEALVERMESGDLSLEELLACYQQGTEISRRMQARLNQAQARLTELSASGSHESEPSDGVPEEDAEATPAPKARKARTARASQPAEADEAVLAKQTSLLDE